ncbi:MAG TPA: dihydrolipoamide acetyltransferase family protein [Ktedonobacteraceae bacterium]|nr:dihydrolipoamide acetyltransferase family protein [Ktedonobacteraceae bacterium]
MYEFKLADLGEGMHEAEIVEWLIHVGDTPKLDQTIARVETDKAIVELPAPVSGKVSEIRFKDGETAKVGDVLVVFETTAPAKENGKTNNAPTTPVSAHVEAANRQSPASITVAVEPQIPAQPRPRVLAAPAVRKLAFELGVELEQVTPSQANGRVTLEDIKSFAERAQTPVGAQFIAPPSPQPTQPAQPTVGTRFIAPSTSTQDERQPLTGLRKRIAEHMERSWRTIPHATAFGEADGGALIAMREALKPVAEQRSTRLTYMPILIKLLIPVLKEFPIFNASLDEERREIIYKRSYHIGVATDSPEGLLVPVLRDADHLTILEIAAKMEHLIEGARKRTLSLPELSGSTFTLNNVGSFGGGSGTPIINHPEVAILAVGKLQEKAIVQNGAIIARPIMPLALSFDHRLIDGAMAGKFLARFSEFIANPQQLMLNML